MLLQELGLRDAAVIEGWVELPKEEPASSSADDAAEGVTVPALALPSLHHRLYPRTKAVLTPADLEKAAHVHEDRDPSFDMQGEYLSDGTEVRATLPLSDALCVPQTPLLSPFCCACSMQVIIGCENAPGEEHSYVCACCGCMCLPSGPFMRKITLQLTGGLPVCATACPGLGPSTMTSAMMQ